MSNIDLSVEIENIDLTDWVEKLEAIEVKIYSQN